MHFGHCLIWIGLDCIIVNEIELIVLIVFRDSSVAAFLGWLTLYSLIMHPNESLRQLSVSLFSACVAAIEHFSLSFSILKWPS